MEEWWATAVQNLVRPTETIATRCAVCAIDMIAKATSMPTGPSTSNKNTTASTGDATTTTATNSRSSHNHGHSTRAAPSGDKRPVARRFEILLAWTDGNGKRSSSRAHAQSPSRLQNLFTQDPDSQQQILQLAEQRIAEAASVSGLHERAEANTRAMLEGMMRALGFEVVTVTFAAP
jgi:beta-mannanase